MQRGMGFFVSRLGVVAVLIGLAVFNIVRSPDGWSGLGLIAAVVVTLPAAGPAVVEWEGSVAYGAAILLAGLLLALGVGLIWGDAGTFAEVYRGQVIPVLVGPIVAVAAGAAIVHGIRQGLEAMKDS